MSGFREGFAYKFRRISLASFDIPTAYPAETIRLRVTYGNVNSHLRGTLVRRDPSLPKGNVADERTWERRSFPCKEFSVSPVVWMLTAIRGALLRQRFIAVLMLLL